MPLISYDTFLNKISKILQTRTDSALEKRATLTYRTPGGEKSYGYVRIASLDIGPKDTIILIRAGIHGDEVAGPHTLMRHISEIFDYAHSHGTKLIIYPLDNPSGFEAGTRYNSENDKGTEGNNDFLRYELEDGSFVGDLGCETGHRFKKWHWSSDHRLNIRLPQETIALHNELRDLPISQIAGAIDLHQDCFLTIPAAYCYAYGDLSRYGAIIKNIRPLIQILKNKEIRSGYTAEQDEPTNPIHHDGKETSDPLRCTTNENGFIIRHDGSFSDLLFRLGVPHSIAVETTGITPPEVADKVNLAWIYGIIDLIAHA